MDLSFHPATADRWRDLEALLGSRGACGGCWCMWWRLPRAVYEHQKGQPNKDALHALVAAGDPPGLLAYADDAPIAWCAIAPRDAYPVLERSRILKRVDDRPVWSVTCFFVARPFRRGGVSVSVLEAATAYAAEQGAMIVEGYPVDPRTPRLPDAFAWTGTISAFRQAGFVEVLRRSDTRPIMRYIIASHIPIRSHRTPVVSMLCSHRHDKKGAHEPMTAVKIFTARVETGERGRVFITVPFDPNATWGQRPRHYVQGTINGAAFSGSLGNRAGVAFFPLNKGLQVAAAISIGSVAQVTLQPAPAETDAVPADLTAALATTDTARRAFDALTPFQHNQCVRWIVDAKKPATRASRVADAVAMLTHGKTLPG